LLYSVIVHLANPVIPEDDAYIIYRYVDNLVAGNGLVYNLGQHVFGASTPLYILWLAGLKAIVRNVPTPILAVRLNFVFYVATALGVFLLLTRLLSPMSGVCCPAVVGRRTSDASSVELQSALLAGLFALRTDLLYVSLGGMEALLFTGMVVWTLWALAARRVRLAGVVAGLSVLARPEGVLLAGVTLIAGLATTGKLGSQDARIPRRRGWLPLLAGLVTPGLVWVVFAFAYYGTPIYHSITAKAAPLYPLPRGAALRDVWAAIQVWTSGGVFPTWPLLAAVLLVAAAVGYVLTLRREHRVSWFTFMPAAFLLILVLFYWVSNPLMFGWYYPVLETLWFASLAVGLILLARAVAQLSPRRPGLSGASRRVASAWVIRALLLLILGYPVLRAPARQLVQGESPFRMTTESDSVRLRVEAYREAAQWLNHVTPEGVSLVGAEIGSLGYYYKGPVIDACALVSPEALPFLPVPDSERYSPGCGAIGRALVRRLQPELIVSMGTFAGKSLSNWDWFWVNYSRLRQIPLPHSLWGTRTVDLYVRRNGPVAERLAVTESLSAYQLRARLDALLARCLSGLDEIRTILWPPQFGDESRRPGSTSPRMLTYPDLYEEAAKGGRQFDDYLPALALWVFGTAGGHPELMRYMDEGESYASGPYLFTLLAVDPETTVAAYVVTKNQ
jgi:hypothetical protein